MGLALIKVVENRHSKYYLFTLFGVLLMMVCTTSALAVVRGTYLYNLSNFTGTIPYNWVRPFVDRERNEIYIANGQDQSVRIFMVRMKMFPCSSTVPSIIPLKFASSPKL